MAIQALLPFVCLIMRGNSYMMTILLPIILPDTILVWVGAVSSGRTSLSRYTMVFAIILYATLQRLIGRNWDGACGLSILGIRVS